MTCKKCGLQYVGETENTLHARMNGHRSDIRTRKTEKPVAVYFCQQNHTIRRSGSDGDREDSQEQQTVEKGKRKLLDLHPQNTVSTLTQSG